MGAERQTNIHTCIHKYIHTYIHTHFVKQFQETRRAPGLKIKNPMSYSIAIQNSVIDDISLVTCMLFIDR